MSAGVGAQTASRRAPPWRRSLPYLGSLAIFVIIFWRIPFREVSAALADASPLAFIGVFLPYSIFYFLIDSACLTWVVNRFNTHVRYRDILPVRASMYLLALINTNLGQGGVAYYLYRKFGIGFLAALGSILFIALLEVYQLFLFSTIGVVFHTPAPGATQEPIVAALRIAYLIAWLLLGAIMLFFAIARRQGLIRQWIETSRIGAIAGAFLKAHPLDYLTVLAIKAPTLLGSIVAHYFALRLYGINIPIADLTRRYELYRQAERIVMDDAPWVPLYNPVSYVIRQPSVRDYQLNPLRPTRLEQVWLAERTGQARPR